MFIYLLYVLIFAPMVHSECGQHNKGIPHILGGVEAPPQFWPFAVYLKFGSEVKCGGVLVAPQYVLTAAHCLDLVGDEIDLTTLIVAVGAHKISRRLPSEQRIHVEEAIVHPDYDKDSQDANDLAILKLAHPVNSAKYWEACLPSKPLPRRQPKTCIVYGYGLKDNGNPSDALRHIDVPVLPIRECKQSWKDLWVQKNICVGTYQRNHFDDTSRRKGPCTGDSGSPIICKTLGRQGWTVYGIVSWGGAICMNKPAVAVDVYKYTSWITSVIEKGPPINSQPPPPPSTRSPQPQTASERCQKKNFEIKKWTEITGQAPITAMFVDRATDCVWACCQNPRCKAVQYYIWNRKKFCKLYALDVCEVPRQQVRRTTQKTAYVGLLSCSR